MTRRVLQDSKINALRLHVARQRLDVSKGPLFTLHEALLTLLVGSFHVNGVLVSITVCCVQHEATWSKTALVGGIWAHFHVIFS